MEAVRLRKLFVFILALCVNLSSCEGPEQGIFTATLTEVNDYIGITKSLSEETEIGIRVDNCSGSAKFQIEWMVRFTECNEIYNQLKENSTNAYLERFFLPNGDEVMFASESYIAIQRSEAADSGDCSSSSTLLVDETNSTSWSCYSTIPISHCNYVGPPITTKAPPAKALPAKAKEDKPAKEGEPAKADEADKIKLRRAATLPVTDAPKPTEKAKAAKVKATEASKTTTPSTKVMKNRVTTTNDRAGRFLFIVHLKPEKPDNKLEVKVSIMMKSKHGYLSATQRPLLIFYGIMCGVYSIMAFLWLLMLACQWRDLLRIQFWIGGVMLLGLLEKAVFYAEYEHLNTEGTSMPGAIIFAELVSCMKRSLARMLVVIVSLGYGITRPRLGRDLHWLMGAGMMYFILSSIEACLRVKGSEDHALIAILPLAVLDAVICWWVFKSLVDTTRTLRLRRNMVKLWLYRHFTNTLIFCVLAAVIFLLWSTKTHRWTTCIKKWHELWLDDAYWHVLFCVILVVIVIIFRPTANNQRYAFSPLTDRGDEKSNRIAGNTSVEGVKMRNVIGNRNESQSSKHDDDLKWVEDNIPAAVADAALGAFDDSEEELVTNLERNKME
ncbi:transmembrane protein 87B-like [Asterias amurensis]|uniref:transmembrane protein 87B-like n=1 Tax=Asterias amurensis TaxID=7602 RepID=UPI003AB81ED9